MQYISIFSTIVTFIFVIAILRRYSQRGGTHQLLWGIGFILYGLGTLSETIMAFTFSSLALKVWYLTGAMLTAAWLGEGTIHLLVRRRNVANIITVVLALVSLAAIVLVLAAPVTGAAASYNVHQPASSQYKDILLRNGFIILLTILLNIYGTLALVGGALYSAFLFWRKKVLLNRMVGNILIATGALMPAIGGSLVKAGLGDWLYLSEFLGVVVMFLGFLQATAPATASQPTKAEASA